MNGDGSIFDDDGWSVHSRIRMPGAEREPARGVGSERNRVSE